MEHDAGDETIAEPVPQPRQVTGRTTSGSAGGSHLERHDPVGTDLGEKVYFAPTVLFAEVVEPRAGRAHGELCAQLADDERVEQPAREVAVAQDRSGVTLRMEPIRAGSTR